VEEAQDLDSIRVMILEILNANRTGKNRKSNFGIRPVSHDLPHMRLLRQCLKIKESPLGSYSTILVDAPVNS
jgi:hypothetical protein